MNTLHTVHIISNLGAGGAERAMARLLVSLGAACGTHEVISLKGRGPVAATLEAAGIAVYGPGRLFSLRAMRRAGLFCGWMYHGNLVVLLAGLLSGGRPVVWHIRQCLHDRSMDGRLTRTLIDLGARLSKASLLRRIVYNSQASRDQHEAIGYARSKGALMRNGFDATRFRPDNTLAADMAALDGAFCIGMVARNHRVKGCDVFLQAVQTLCRAHPQATPVFVLVGRGFDDSNPAIAAVRRTLPQLRLLALGERSDVDAILPGLDVLTSASRSEGLSNTLCEAMLSGVPCVVTDVGDSAFVVGDTGLVVPPGDAAALAAAWWKMMNEPGLQKAQSGTRCRERIRKYLSLEQQKDAFMQVIESSLTTSRNGG
ncbi:glycosyltransferase [Granulosicoccaceae sp. 1_MG-2023]|nr:glycosyltransferase [Granulosicoccaceae sp. 1_MG-2023]